MKRQRDGRSTPLYSSVMTHSRTDELGTYPVLIMAAGVVAVVLVGGNRTHIYEWIIVLYTMILGVYLGWVLLNEYVRFDALHRLKSRGIDTLLLGATYAAIFQASRSTVNIQQSFLWLGGVLVSLVVWEGYTMWKGHDKYFRITNVDTDGRKLRRGVVPSEPTNATLRHWYEYRYWVILDGALIFVAGFFWFATGGVLQIMTPTVASVITCVTGTAVGAVNVLRYRVVLEGYRLPGAPMGDASPQSDLLPHSSLKSRFDVALSFPGERRTFVEQVAFGLRAANVRVFYDRFYEAELAQPDLDVILQGIYRNSSDLVAVFLCEKYAAKEWCGLEWRAVRSLIKSRLGATIMLLRFDEAEIPGLFSFDGYVDLIGRTPGDVVEIIRCRLADMRRTPAV